MRALFAALLVATSAAACHAEAPATPPDAPSGSASAVFAGGCFWCMEPPFDGLDGVLSTTSGYTGGSLANPTYEQVTAGGTGHVEAVKVVYDPKRVDYAKLLDVYWRNVDPLDDGGQFCDRGDSYRSAIFAGNDQERRLVEASKDAVSKQLGKPVATTIRDAAPFYPAEEYHQDYYRKNPIRYRYYRGGCGRDARLEEVWGKAAAQDH